MSLSRVLNPNRRLPPARHALAEALKVSRILTTLLNRGPSLFGSRIYSHRQRHFLSKLQAMHRFDENGEFNVIAVAIDFR